MASARIAPCARLRALGALKLPVRRRELARGRPLGAEALDEGEAAEQVLERGDEGGVAGGDLRLSRGQAAAAQRAGRDRHRHEHRGDQGEGHAVPQHERHRPREHDRVLGDGRDPREVAALDGGDVVGEPGHVAGRPLPLQGADPLGEQPFERGLAVARDGALHEPRGREPLGVDQRDVGDQGRRADGERRGEGRPALPRHQVDRPRAGHGHGEQGRRLEQRQGDGRRQGAPVAAVEAAHEIARERPRGLVGAESRRVRSTWSAGALPAGSLRRLSVMRGDSPTTLPHTAPT